MYIAAFFLLKMLFQYSDAWRLGLVKSDDTIVMRSSGMADLAKKPELIVARTPKEIEACKKRLNDAGFKIPELAPKTIIVVAISEKRHEYIYEKLTSCKTSEGRIEIEMRERVYSSLNEFYDCEPTKNQVDVFFLQSADKKIDVLTYDYEKKGKKNYRFRE